MDSQIKAFFTSQLKQGYTFRKVLRELEESQHYTREQLDGLQNKKLKQLVEHCYRNVPYYTDLFNRLKLKPEDIRTKTDLDKLPLMTKKTVRDNFDKLIARNKPGILIGNAETSGTTGTPSRFLRDYYSINFENAALWRFREAVDGNGHRRVILRGDVVVPVDRKQPPFWKEYPLCRELYLSSYHITGENAPQYYGKMEEFGAESIYAFPSSVYRLAKCFQEQGLKIPLKAVFTSSENISERQRALIEEVFRCRVYDWYGQVERVSAIGQCEQGTYHIIEDYSITETIPTEVGHELVGTNFNNAVMPLIRFRTGDMVTLGTQSCTCGRHFREVSRISGRSQEYVITPGGGKVLLFFVSDSIDVDDHVEEAQFIQEKPGELLVNIVRGEQYTEYDRSRIIRRIKEHTSPDMVVTLTEVGALTRGANGKVVNAIVRHREDDAV